MGVIFNCPHCNGQMEADEGGLKGRLVSCPHCGAQVKVPDEGTAATGDSPEAAVESPAEPEAAEEPETKAVHGESEGLSEGTIIRGIYKIEKRLGESSIGEMYVGSVVTDGRKVQLEIIDGSDQETIDRLSREIDILAAMQHPNIVRAFDAGQDGDIFFLASEFEEGETLYDILQQGPISESKALGYTKDIAKALDYAWEQRKILHRDIKPANIFITNNGVAKLMGFGIAKSGEGQSMGLTGVGFTVGTPEYMSPEQIKAEEDLDFRADMYSLGCVLYQMTTGNLPFDESAPILLMQKHMDEDPVPPNQVNPQVSAGCADVVATMMMKDRNERPESWNALTGLIDQALAGGGGSAPPKTSSGGGSASTSNDSGGDGKKGCAGVFAVAATLVIGIGAALLKLL